MTAPVDYNAGLPLTESVNACKTSLATLQRLGASDRAEGPLTDAEATSYTAILDDTTRSNAWKLQTCAAKYIGVMSTLARKLTSAATVAGSQDADDAARVFGVKGLSGDVASLAISRRDAGDRIDDNADSTSLQRLLATAVRNGDEVLAHVIAEHAITNGDLDLLNQFVEAYPGLEAAAQRLWDSAQTRTSTTDVMSAWRIGALKPRTLASLQDYEIASAASGNANAGSWSA